MIARIQDQTGRFRARASAFVLLVAAGCSSDTPPSSEQQIPAGVTQWAPDGARTVGSYDYEIIPQPNAF